MDTVHFTGLGLQFAASIVGAMSLTWLRVKSGHLEINVKELKSAKRVGLIVLWMLAVGFLLELFYEIYQLQTA